MKFVLDTRFLAEYFYTVDTRLRHEASQKLDELSRDKDGIIPTIVVCELIKLICSDEGKERSEMIYSSLVKSGLKIESLTPSIAKEAGLLKSVHRNVPVGDCIIAATAIKNQARIISDDRHFDEIEGTKRVWL